MARTKEFDPDTALSAALDLFWQRGYEATSMADLVGHLGVSRASIYATFGDKHELYLAALDHYLRTRDAELIAVLSQPGPALPTVRTLVETSAAQSADDRVRRGCFVVNTAVELLPGDQDAARRVAASWNTLEVALAGALTRARAQGELGSDRDPRGLARFLLVLLQGIRVLGHAEPHAERLHDAVHQAFRVLE